MIIRSNCNFCGTAVVRKTECKMHFCDLKCKAEWQRTQKPVTKEWLIDAYITKGLNCTEIAQQVKRDSKSVWNWLKDFGIETRKRGTTGNHKYSIGVPRVLTEAGRKILSETAKAARLKDGRKPYLINGVHWLKATGRKPATWKGGISPERQSFYASLEWVNAVKEVWKRDKGICQRCGIKQTKEQRGTFAIHHIESFRVKELRAEVTNLLLVCRPCHLWIHSRKNINKEFLGNAKSQLDLMIEELPQ